MGGIRRHGWRHHHAAGVGGVLALHEALGGQAQLGGPVVAAVS